MNRQRDPPRRHPRSTKHRTPAPAAYQAEHSLREASSTRFHNLSGHRPLGPTQRTPIRIPPDLPAPQTPTHNGLRTRPTRNQKRVRRTLLRKVGLDRCSPPSLNQHPGHPVGVAQRRPIKPGPRTTQQSTGAAALADMLLQMCGGNLNERLNHLSQLAGYRTVAPHSLPRLVSLPPVGGVVQIDAVAETRASPPISLHEPFDLGARIRFGNPVGVPRRVAGWVGLIHVQKPIRRERPSGESRRLGLRRVRLRDGVQGRAAGRSGIGSICSLKPSREAITKTSSSIPWFSRGFSKRIVR